MQSYRYTAALLAALCAPVAICGAQIEAGFSPCWAGRVCAADLVVRAIDGALPGQAMLVAAYGLTSKPIESALLAAKARGVNVRVVFDAKSNRRGVVAKHLIDGGIPLRISDRYGIMHNKFIVIGIDTVETASFNFTEAATKRKAENVVLIKGDHILASSYSKAWQRLWDEAGPAKFPKD